MRAGSSDRFIDQQTRNVRPEVKRCYASQRGALARGTYMIGDEDGSAERASEARYPGPRSINAGMVAQGWLDPCVGDVT